MFDLNLQYRGPFNRAPLDNLLQLNAVDLDLAPSDIATLVDTSPSFGSSLIDYLSTKEGKQLLLKECDFVTVKVTKK
jgi:hypothetical protein